MTVGVVGAGITGLALAHHLDARGVDVRVFEAADRPGGVIRSAVVDGRVLEYGPQRTRLTGPVADLVAAAGLEDELLEADDDLPLYVYAGGSLRRVPTSARSFVATDLLSWRGKLRVLAEPLTGPGRPDETAAGLFRRKFGAEAYENVVGPLYGGIYGSDPARMPADRALAGLLRLERAEGSLLRPAVRRLLSNDAAPAASFEAGLERLPAALAEGLGDRVRLDAPVEGLAADGDGYRLAVDGERVPVDEVVLTTPAGATADLVEGLDGDSADALRELRYNPLAVVHLHADVDRRGLGYQVRRDEGLATLGVSWNASFFDRDGVYTAFLGGMHDPDLLEEDDGALGDLAAREFEAVVGAPASVLDVTRLPAAMPAYDHSWSALDRVSLPAGVHLATNYTGRVGIPSRVAEAEALAATLAERRDG